MAQADFDPVEFAGKVGTLEGTLRALVNTMEEHHRDETKNFDEVFERLRRLESRNGWRGKATTIGYGGGAGTLIMFGEYLLKHFGTS